MIYVTGDVHGTISITERLNTKNFPQQKEMTKSDYVIITGDFGLIWDGSKEDHFWLKWLDDTKPFTTLFIDGNHENFDILEQYPIEMWNGGKVHRINDSVIHLMRGQVFNIDGKKFFTFGGAASHDKEHRRVNISWWEREMPSYAEYEEGLENLDKNHWIVDYVLTHTCSLDALEWLVRRYNLSLDVDQMHRYFNEIASKLEYDQWFFGHFHQDVELPNKQRLLYMDIVKL